MIMQLFSAIRGNPRRDAAMLLAFAGTIFATTASVGVPTVKGKVVNSGGSGVTGAQVTVQDAKDDAKKWETTVNASDGAYSMLLRGVNSRIEFKHRVTADGYQPSVTKRREAGSNDTVEMGTTELARSSVVAQGSDPKEIAGLWEFVFETQMGENRSEATFTIQNGHLSGTISSEIGEGVLSAISYDNYKLSFTQSLDMAGQEFEIRFIGTVQDEEIRGVLRFNSGLIGFNGGLMDEIPFRARRIRSRGGRSSSNSTTAVGTWDSVSGLEDSALTISRDLTGSMTLGGESFDVNALVVENETISFRVTVVTSAGEQTINFRGKVEQDSLVGEISSDQGQTFQVRYRRRD